MGRKRKQGFSYFPLDIDFFSDIRIRKLIKNNGSQAVSIYLCVLTFIYENGYYVVNDRDLGFVISERTGCRESMVSAVLSYCVSIGLFDETMYKQGVFTSKSVQERYFLMCKSAKRTIVFSEYSLISSEKMRISSEEIAINSEKSTQSKVKNNYMHNYSDINNICKNEILKISSEEITINSEEKKEKISPQPPKKRKSQGDRQLDETSQMPTANSKKPDLNEFLAYAEEIIVKNNLGDFSLLKFSLEAKYNAWNEAGWKDGNGSPIKNWKTKLQNVLPYLRPISNLKNNGQAVNTTGYQPNTNGYQPNNYQPNAPASGRKISAREFLAQKYFGQFANDNSATGAVIDVEAHEL